MQNYYIGLDIGVASVGWVGWGAKSGLGNPGA